MGLLDNTTQQEYYNGNDFGNYQFTSLDNIINQFMVSYVGENKIISKIKRVDVAFHAQRALQELSFDTFKSCKSQEIDVPPTLQMILPQDYVNYTKISWVDSVGIKHLLYPTSKTSNPKPILQNSDKEYALTAIGTLNSTTKVVLDGEYKNILVGMVVSAPSIDPGSTVTAVSNASSITTLTISNAATYTGTETLTFTNTDDGLLLEEESAFIVENLSWNIDDFKITASAASDISDIKVGMKVSHDYFPSTTTVVDVNGAVITTSHLPEEVMDSGGEVTFLSDILISDTWSNYKSATPSENQNDYQDDRWWPYMKERYGLDPQHAQANGSFYIDCYSGKIHFSSNMSGETVVLDYISDSLGTDDEMQVHKFAEEAMYKWIAHAILSTRANVPEYQVARFKKERFAAIRKAKLRLSNIKLEEITQVLRGKSKHIKH